MLLSVRGCWLHFAADGGLCGLENSVSHGAMLHFGPDVASKAIAKTSSSDPDLLKLMPAGSMSKKKPKKSKVRKRICRCLKLDHLLCICVEPLTSRFVVVYPWWCESSSVAC